MFTNIFATFWSKLLADSRVADQSCFQNLFESFIIQKVCTYDLCLHNILYSRTFVFLTSFSIFSFTSVFFSPILRFFLYYFVRFVLFYTRMI